MGQLIPRIIVMPWNAPPKSEPLSPPLPPPKCESKSRPVPQKDEPKNDLLNPLTVVAGLTILDAILGE
jgi:hypothetical protein